MPSTVLYSSNFPCWASLQSQNSTVLQRSGVYCLVYDRSRHFGILPTVEFRMVVSPCINIRTCCLTQQTKSWSQKWIISQIKTFDKTSTGLFLPLWSFPNTLKTVLIGLESGCATSATGLQTSLSRFVPVFNFIKIGLLMLWSITFSFSCYRIRIIDNSFILAVVVAASV